VNHTVGPFIIINNLNFLFFYVKFAIYYKLRIIYIIYKNMLKEFKN